MPASDILDCPLEEAELGVRAYNILKRNGVDTISELMLIGVHDFMHWAIVNPNHTMGYRAAREIEEAQEGIERYINA